MNTIRLAPRFHAESIDYGPAFALDLAPQSWSGLNLFSVPEHLRRLWWTVAADELLTQSAERPGFDEFLEAFREFAEFKKIPISSSDAFGMIARPPGLPAQDPYAFRALINLGDEATEILVNGEKFPLAPGDGLWISDASSVAAADTMMRTDLDILFAIYLAH